MARKTPLPQPNEHWIVSLREPNVVTVKAVASGAIDAAAALAGFSIASLLLRAVTAFEGGWIFNFSIIPASLLVVLLFALLGLYAEPGLGPCQTLKLRVQGTMIAAGFAALAVGSTNAVAATLAWICIACVATLVVGYFGQWSLTHLLTKLGRHGAPAAIIGTGEQAQKIADGLLKFPEIGLRPIGFVALPEQPPVGKELPLPLLSRLEHVEAIDPRIKIAVLAMPPRDHAEIERMLGPLPFPHIATIQDMNVLHKMRLQSTAHLPSLAQTNANTAVRRQNSRLAMLGKRALDLAIALPMAILTAPVVLIAVAAVRLADPGPAIYKQQRIGLNGRTFNVYKIRTMYQDAEARLDRCLANDPSLAKEWSENFKLRHDPRILARFGKFLRSYSIDELPQLWNIVKGDMSLVGPRPFPLYHIKSFDEEFQRYRATVMPGLTGLWQITARSDGDLTVQQEQDTLYIDNWSFWLDLHILLQTVPAVLSAKGAR